MNAGTFHYKRGEKKLAEAEDLAGRNPELAAILTELADKHFEAARVAVAAHAAGLVHKTGERVSDWWLALHGEERS